MRYSFRYTADVFPSEFSLSVWTDYGPNAPLLLANWTRPDGVFFNLLLLNEADLPFAGFSRVTTRAGEIPWFTENSFGLDAMAFQ